MKLIDSDNKSIGNISTLTTCKNTYAVSKWFNCTEI